MTRAAPSGLPAVGDLAWGTHLCQLHRDRDELVRALASYFAAGLENGERCLWMTSASLAPNEAWAALGAIVPDLEERRRREQIEIAELGSGEVVRTWDDRERAAIEKGFEGLRISCDLSSVEPKDWPLFADREASVFRSLHGRRVIVLCCYPLARCSSSEIAEVLRNHDVALVKSETGYERVPSAMPLVSSLVDASDHLSRLQHVTSALSEAASADDIARVVVSEMPRAVGADRAILVVPSQNGSMLKRLGETSDGPDAEFPIESPFPLSVAYRTGEAVWLASPDEIRSQYGWVSSALAWAQAIAVQPLVIGRQRIGAIGFGFKNQVTFSPKVRSLVADIGRQASLALERARLYEQAKEATETLRVRAKHQTAVADLGRRALMIDASALMGEAVRTVIDTLGVHVCKVLELQPEGDLLIRAGLGLREGLVGQVRVPASRGSQAGYTLQVKELVIVDDLKTETRFKVPDVLFEHDVASGMSVAIPAAGRYWGVLGAHSKTPRRFTDDDAQFIRSVANVIGAALQKEAAEAEQRASQARLAGIVASAMDAIISVDSEQRITLFNSAAERMFGVLATQAIGRSLERFIPERFRGRIGNSLPEVALRADGTEFPIEATLSKVEVSGQTFFVVIIRDVTERKRAEDALYDANRRKDEFIAVLGHELRNPLAPIMTALELMKLRGDVQAERERAVIERQVKHVSRLVDDLLDVSRITRGKVELKKEPLEVSMIVARAIEMTSPIIEQRAHRLSVDVPRTGMVIEADRLRFAQAIANLLTNAAKYTDPGGEILVRAARMGNRVAISVTDTGIGLRPEQSALIFEPFVQVQRTVERAQGGLGLGLALVKSLIELHGGTVSVHSDGPGAGSLFTISVPALGRAAKTEEIEAIGPRVLRAPPSLTKRVLVVDDNPDAAESLAALLRSVGHSVVEAFDGAQALKKTESFAFEIAILDIGLPVIDGYELARRLRERSPDRMIRFIAVTGYGTEEDRGRSRAAGFEAHFVKPIDHEVLLRRLAAPIAAVE
jgi:PAS domain S-box-containing protein